MMHTWTHAPSTPLYIQVYCVYIQRYAHTITLTVNLLSGPQSRNSLEVYACHILNIRARWMLLHAWRSGTLDKTIRKKNPKQKTTLKSNKHKTTKHLLVISLRHIISTKKKKEKRKRNTTHTQHKRMKVMINGKLCKKWFPYLLSPLEWRNKEHFWNKHSHLFGPKLHSKLI